MPVINKIGEWLIEGQRWGSNFNMYAPASGCTSDLRGRSYDPLSTDDAAASYHDQGPGSPILLFHLVQPSRPSRCCRLFKQRRCVPRRLGGYNFLLFARWFMLLYATRRYVAVWYSGSLKILTEHLHPVSPVISRSEIKGASRNFGLPELNSYISNVYAEPYRALSFSVIDTRAGNAGERILFAFRNPTRGV